MRMSAFSCSIAQDSEESTGISTVKQARRRENEKRRGALSRLCCMLQLAVKDSRGTDVHGRMGRRLALSDQGIVHAVSGARDGSRALGRRRRLLEEQETHEGSMESAVLSRAAAALEDASSVFKPHIHGLTLGTSSP